MEIKFTDQQLQAVQDATDKAVAEFIQGLPGLINKKLEATVTSMLGLRLSFGNWEIDPRPGTSPFSPTDLISKVAKEEALKLFGHIGDNFKFSAAMKKDLREHFEKSVQETVKRDAYEISRKAAKEILDEILATENVKVIVVPTDPCNPKTGETALGEVVLERTAKVIIQSATAKEEAKVKKQWG